ncbi:MAG: hypothetical protein AB7N65_01185 [Vicinamibacterales bacterium]
MATRHRPDSPGWLADGGTLDALIVSIDWSRLVAPSRQRHVLS